MMEAGERLSRWTVLLEERPENGKGEEIPRRVPGILRFDSVELVFSLALHNNIKTDLDLQEESTVTKKHSCSQNKSESERLEHCRLKRVSPIRAGGSRRWVARPRSPGGGDDPARGDAGPEQSERNSRKSARGDGRIPAGTEPEESAVRGSRKDIARFDHEYLFYLSRVR